MCLEDVAKQRHRLKRRAGNIHRENGLSLRGLRAALEIRRPTSRWIGPGMLGDFRADDV